MNLIESQACRTCLQKNAATLPLQTEIKQCSNPKTYKDVLKDLTQIKFIDDHEDCMPQSICQLCSIQLKSSYEFILQAEKCNDELMEMLTKNDDDDYLDCLKETTIDIFTDANLNTKEDIDELLNDFAQKIETTKATKEEPKEDETIIKFELGEESVYEEQTIDSTEDQESRKNITDDNNEYKDSIQHIKSFYNNQADYSTENNKIKCYFCESLQGRKYDLVKHIKRKHRPKILELKSEITAKDMEDECDPNFFVEEEELIRYLINLKKSISTDQTTFTSNAGSKLNTIKHRSYICRLCDNSFTQKRELLTHLKKTHKQEELKKENTLQDITRKNTTDRQVSKDNIKLIKSFYINHADYATENNKIKCYFCETLTGRKYDLVKHIKRKHMCQIVQLKCGITAENVEDESTSNLSVDEDEVIRYLINLKNSISTAYNQMIFTSNADSKLNTIKNRSNKYRLCDSSYTKKREPLRHIKETHKQAVNELKKEITVQEETSNLESQEDARPANDTELENDFNDDDDDDNADVDGDEFMPRLLNQKIKKTYINGLPRSCDICEKVLKNAYVLKKHKRFVHASEDDLFPCTLCANKYKRKNQLEFHIQNKHSTTAPPKRPKKPPPAAKYMCSYCSHCFTASTSLNIHIIRKHAGERPFKCDICDRRFLNSFMLRIHSYIHSGEKPYKCSYCSKAFRLSACLTKHKRIHTNERPYQCNECSKSFTTDTNLKSHKRVHKNTASFSCNVCGKIFNTAALLNLHRINNNHPDEIN